MSDIKVIHHDECQLLDWGESRSTGPWVKLRLSDVEYLEQFRGLDTATATKTGHIFNVTITQGDIIAAKDPKLSKYGAQAKELRLSSFFRRPEVWRVVGADGQFLDWLKRQVCSVHGGGCFRKDNPVVPAHVRRVQNGSGTGIKPEYSAIPLCNELHQLQHNSGESSVNPREWWDKKRIEYLVKWCWETLKSDLGYDSWSEVPPTTLINWVTRFNVSGRDGKMWLPRCYYDHKK